MKGMKRTRIIALAMLMVMIISMLPVSEVSAKTTKKAGPVLRENSAVLYLKDKYATSCQLQIDNAASNAEITYKSSNSKVATVSSTGKVTPLKKGKATITAVVKQNRKKYTLSFDCTVKKASLSFGTSKAKNTTGEKAASIEVGKTLKTGLRLNGEIASVYTKSNTENYNVRATVYSAKTGKKLASYKNAGDNKYVTVSENGRITGNKAGRYYIDFTSYPKGLSSRIYVTVSKAKKPKTPEKTENVETPEVPTESEDGEEDGKQSDAGTVFVTPAPYAQNIPDVPTTPAPSKDDKHTKYLVSFKAAKGMENIGAELPEAAEYEDGTLVDKLPTPYLFNGIFMGWYYDADKTQAAKANDVIDSERTLYADFMLTQGQDISETPSFISVTLSPDEADRFTFGIKGYEEGCIDSFTDIADDSEVEYSVQGETIIPVLDKGKTYSIILKDNGPLQENDRLFVVNGEDQPASVVTLNIITEKEAVMKLSVADGMLFLPADEISEIKGSLMNGLFTVQAGDDGENNVKENQYKGSFRYNGSEKPEVGDTVAIYEGARPDERTLSISGTAEDGEVAYVVITGRDGDKYSYNSADAEDVLKFTEILPVSVNADKDGDRNNNSLTADISAFDFSAEIYSEMGLDENTTVNAGDYIAFYTGSDPESGEPAGYARVKRVNKNGNDIIVEYEAATLEEIEASMDINSTRDADIDLTAEEVEKLEEDIRNQAYDSGFLDEAANYLVALAVETDGFKELSEDFDLDLESYNIRLNDGTEADPDSLRLMGSSVYIKDSETVIDVKIKPNTSLEHFKNRNGISVELGMNLVVVFQSESVPNGHMELNLQANFIEEAVLKVNIDGGAVWKKKWIIPYIADYKATANLDVGNYTNVGITATLKTVRDIGRVYGESDKESTIGKLWKKVNTKRVRDSILDIGKQMTELAGENNFMSGLIDELYPETPATLSEKYAKFIKDSGSSWINIVKKEIFKVEGSIDPLHILAFGVSASFVVKANLYITMGAKFETGDLKRYTYTIKLFSRSVSTKVTDLENHNLMLEFYVFGTAGIRIGLELEVYVGLFSKKIDSVGIVAGAGAYAQLWGYFYFKYEEKVNAAGKPEKEKYCNGALYFEMGFYLEVKFRAQFFNSAKLTYEPTIYEKNWVLLTVGDKNDVTAFKKANGDDGYSDTFEIIGTREQTIDRSVFDMSYLDLKTGKTGAANYDDETESHYEISFSNKYFSYDPKSDKVKISVPKGESVYEESDMKIVWNGNALAFSAVPIVKNVKLIWSDPENARCIYFDSNGGSMVKTVALAIDKPVVVPADSEKQGYVFDGWYLDEELAERFVFPETMPDYENKGVTVYAKWLPAKDTPFTVEHYVQSRSGKYVLTETVVETGETDSYPAPDTIAKEFEGAVYYDSSIPYIRPDGQSLMRMYYNLKDCDIYFSYGALENGTEDTEPLHYSVKYGAMQYAPSLVVPGYIFLGFKGLKTDEDGNFAVTDSAVYEAEWKESEDTPYIIEHYLVNPEVDVNEAAGVVYREGRTGSEINLENEKFVGSEYIFKRYAVKNTAEDKPVISAKGDTVIRLYYDRTEYLLTYKDGSDTYLTPSLLKWGRKIARPADPKKQGYIFTGWYLDENCTAESFVDFSGLEMPMKGLTLYAGWTSADDTKYIVEHYLQNPDDDGYTLYKREDSFKGTTGTVVTAEYISIENAVSNEAAEETVRSAEIRPDGSTVLKLYYDRSEVNITFDANAGSFEDGRNNITETYRFGQRFEADVPQREDYGFEGWFDALGRKYVYGTPVESTEEISLHAEWKAGEVGFRVEHYVMNTDGSYPETCTLYVPDNSGVVNSELILADFADDALISSYENGIVYSYGEVKATGITEKCEKTSISKDMVIRLYYERKKYSLTWDMDGKTPQNQDYTRGEVYYGTAITAPCFNVEGYKYSYMKMIPAKTPEGQPTYIAAVPSVMPAGDTEYRVVFEPISFKVNLHYGSEASETEEQYFVYGVEQELKSYTKTGYILAGWALEVNGVSVKYSDREEASRIISTDGTELDLYAVWEPKAYKIRLYIDMYEFTAVQDKMTVDWNNEVSLDVNGYYVDYIYGSEYTLPTPDITGCTFKGWNPVGAGWKNTTDTEKIIVPGNNHLDFDALTDDCISLTAVVVANTYGISWDTCVANDDVTITAAGTESVRFDECSSITVPELSSDKWDYLDKTYTFEGWYTKKDGQGKKLDDSFDELITTDTTFYANWTASDRICTVTVIFENDESVSYEVGYGKIYEEVANVDYILETVVLEDNAYGEFAGWIVCDKAGNPKLDSDNKLQNWESYKSTKVDEDITLYPQWDYYLWLFGERVNSIESNKLKRNYAPNAAEGGVATFDISTFTITLDNCESVIKSEDALSSAQISNYYLDDGVRKYKYEQIKASILSKINTDTLNIELKGENLIDVVLSEINGGCNYGAIAICRSNLCIIDSQDNRGKLTVHVDDSGSSADYIFGICVPDDTYFQGSENSSPAVYLWIGCDIYNREKYFNQNAGLCGTYYMSDVILKGDKLNNLYGIIERNAGSLISGSLFILVDYVIRTGKKNNAIHTSFGSSMNEERNLDFNIVSDAAEYALFGIGEYYEYELWLHLPEFEAMDRYEAYKHQLSGKVYVGSYDKDFNHFRFRQCCAYGMNDMQLISDLLYDGFLEKNVGDE